MSAPRPEKFILNIRRAPRLAQKPSVSADSPRVRTGPIAQVLQGAAFWLTRPCRGVNAMTPEQFTEAMLEYLFVRGFDCYHSHLIPLFAQAQRQPGGDWLAVAAFAEHCIQTGIALQPVREGKRPSPTAGACERWLAVHEAGHAVVGVRSGLVLRGVRFYGDDGFPGEAGFEHFDWGSSTDEMRLRRHIRVDVAANLAELILGIREPDGGRPSLFFDHHDPALPGAYPSDIVDAWKCARRLALLPFARSGAAPDADAVRKARRRIVEQAEEEAEQILRDNVGALRRLTDQLQCGPTTGAAVRAMLVG